LRKLYRWLNDWDYCRSTLIDASQVGLPPIPISPENAFQATVCPKDQYLRCPSLWCLRAVDSSNGERVTIDRWIVTQVETSSIRTRKAGQLVRQAETLALANVDEPLHVSALCKTMGISERTLRKAFHTVHGTPPCRHFRMLRLSNARRALLSADSALAKVTEIALSFGFAELGRFSVEYKKAFGESPSQTLYRSSQDRIPARSVGAISALGHRSVEA
jgi:AraC-like DNA-binding protein